MFPNRKANAALAASLVFLLLSSCAAYLAFSRLQTSEQWVRHTRDVQSELARFAMTSSRAGRMRAEYVRTGDPSFLRRYNEETGKLRTVVDSIQKLTADNARQQADCNRLRKASEQRIEVMNSSVDLTRSGKSTLEAQNQITGQIMARAEESDTVVLGMYNTEEELLDDREARVQFSSTTTSGVLITSLFLTLVLFLIHNQLLGDQVKARTRAETTQRALSARLMTLQDEERRRFARELHDSVGQHLAAMKMAISRLQSKLPGYPVVQDCLNLLDASISETRTISHLLHPPLLDEAGLNSAMRWFVEGFAQRSGITVNLNIQEPPERLSEGIELVLFRVLQESLTNVHRHSSTKQADVTLETTGSDVVLSIKDYGHGLPPGLLDSLQEDGTGGGVGLAGMTERVREIGGRLEVKSSRAGTEIVAYVPIRLRPRETASPSQAQGVA